MRRYYTAKKKLKNTVFITFSTFYHLNSTSPDLVMSTILFRKLAFPQAFQGFRKFSICRPVSRLLLPFHQHLKGFVFYATVVYMISRYLLQFCTGYSQFSPQMFPEWDDVLGQVIQNFFTWCALQISWMNLSFFGW